MKTCPRCNKQTLKVFFQEDLEGGKRKMEECTSCGFTRRVYEPSKHDLGTLVKFNLVRTGG
jgi:Zn ribbon nucleic-acid-binding protein